MSRREIKPSEIKNWLVDHPDYVSILKDLIEFEESNIGNNEVWIQDKEFDTCWRNTKVGYHPSKLYQLEANGILERVMDTNSTTAYAIKDRDRIKEIVDGLAFEDEDGIKTVIHEFPSTEEELDGAFDKVVGYDDVKWLFKRAITTDSITNILLVGPPGSAKTVFLMCIEELGDARFISGKPTSGPGVLDVMFEETPKYMLIDEMDDMDGEAQQVLSQYTETGIVDETKIGKNRKMKTNTKTFGSANSTDSIIQQIEDRFLDLHFEPYTKEEFIEVCENILVNDEDKDIDVARIIAEGVWDIEGEADVRKAIQVARITRDDPEKVLGVLRNYSSSDLSILG